MFSNVDVRRSVAVGTALDMVINIWRKKRLRMIVITGVVTITLLAALGFWNADSARYWRRPAQSTLFFAARNAPRALVARLTRWALRTHVAGTTYAETEEAASLFERAGDGKAASALWLGLVRPDVASQNYDQAVRHAILSHNVVPNPNALVALVVLNENFLEARDHWISEIQSRYPDHELSRIFRGLEQLESFGNPLPASFEAVDWIHQKALSQQDEYQKISQQIEDLPNESARNIKQNETSIAKLTEEQEANQSKYVALSAEIDRLKREGTWDAVKEAVYNALPIPKAGDTWETYFAREGLCALPVIKWVCWLLDLKPFYELRKKQKELTESRDLVAEIWRLNRSLISHHKSDIKYWRSNEPLEKLVRARESLIPAFRSDVEQNVFERREQVGIPVLEAIAIAAY